jgi:hypothetical protein
MLARTALLTGGLAIFLAPIFPVPPGTAAVLARFSLHPAAEADLRSAFDADYLPKNIPDYINVGSEEMNLRVPVQLTGIPEGWSVDGDAVQWDIEAADGQRWRSSWQLERFPLPPDGRYQAAMPIGAAFWKRERKARVRVHARLAYTLIAPAQITRLRNGPELRTNEMTESAQRFPSGGSPGPCTALLSAKVVAVSCLSPLHRPESAVLSILFAGGPSPTGVRADWRGSDAGFSVWQEAEAAQQLSANPVELQVDIREPASHFVREMDVRDFPLERCPIDFSGHAGGFAVGWSPF